MYPIMHLAALLLSFTASTVCKSTFSPARPPAIPLAVRSPYLNTFQMAGSDGGNGGYLAGQFPTFWAGAITGWTGMIRVDLQNYIWMGAPNISSPLVTQTAFSYTSTRSTFTMNVNNAVQMIIEFFSPVTPNDIRRSSLPVSYMNVQVSSTDGQAHFVQLYTDVTAEWASGDRNAVVQWDYGVTGSGAAPAKRDEENNIAAAKEKRQQSTFTTYATRTAYQGWTATVNHPQHTASPPPVHVYPALPPKPSAVTSAPPEGPTHAASGGVAYHRFYRQTQLEFSEINDQTEYGYWYYATRDTSDLSHQSGSDVRVRQQFTSEGFLTNAKDKRYRSISNNYPTYAFARQLGMVQPGQPKAVHWTMNLVQENVIRFEAAQGNVTLPGLWTSYFPTDMAAVNFFYNDFNRARGLGTQLDQRIAADSVAKAGQDYLTITSLGVRQAFGALQYANTPETPYVFLKEISSDGNTQTVDVIFPFHPIALYLNPQLLRHMLDPIFINSEAGRWPFAFTIHDLGSHYPNATGHDDGMAEKQPLEECGNMIIMSLAYAQRTNDNEYLSTHYSILRQWNNFLVEEALIPDNQISTDDFAGSLKNQTNLALKGIIGIAAMAEIAQRAGHPRDAANYTRISKSYINQWQDLAIAKDANPPHTTLRYGRNNTHGLLYNLYADRELSLQLVPQSVYDMQSTFYPTVALEYGVPLDTRHPYTKDDWEIWCAAIASDSTRDLFTSKLVRFINETPTNFAVTDLYNANNATYPLDVTFINRPVVGGWFAPLALNSAPTS